MAEDKALLSHIKQLGLGSIKEYTAWCKNQGIGSGLNKTDAQRRKELSLLKEKRLKEVIAENKDRFKPLGKKIEDSLKGTSSKFSKQREAIFSNLRNKFGWDSIQSMPESIKNEFLSFLVIIAKKSKIVDYKMEESLFAIFQKREHWIKKPEDWTPKTKNIDRQFSSLLRHLFTNYKLPVFLDSAWTNVVYKNPDIDWFIFLAKGNNIRKAENLPLTMTKSMSHIFMDAPDNYSIQEAFRYAQVISMGGDRRLVETIIQTHMGRGFSNNEFWTTVISFFIQNPFLDRNQFGPIVDYLQNQKFGVNAPQPNLTMKGRNPQGLLDAVENWHKDLQKAKSNSFKKWDKSGFKEFHKQEQSGNIINSWTVVEMTNSDELLKDSRSLHHCVSSYAGSCFLKKCSIFSIRYNDVRVATIEVIPSTRSIVQARERYNAQLSAKSRQIMQEWAAQAGLRISC